MTAEPRPEDAFTGDEIMRHARGIRYERVGRFALGLLTYALGAAYIFAALALHRRVYDT